MKKRVLAGVVVLLLIPFLGGCMLMHTGMDDMMGHGSGHGGHQNGKTIVKEVEQGGLKVQLEVPPLAASRESTLLVKVADATTGDPRSDVRVRMIITNVGTHGSSHGGRNDLGTYEAVTGKDRGVFEVRYKFEEPGSYEITALVDSQGAVSPPAKVSLVQEVDHKKESSISRTTWMVLGGIGMVLMMGLMML